LADATADRVLADFAQGRAAVRNCLPVRGDAFEFGRCTSSVIWRPFGRLLKAVPYAIQFGANYEILMMGGAVSGLSAVMTLDADVRDHFRGNYRLFCNVFRIDYTELLTYRREALKGLGPDMLKTLHLLPSE
jgi:hypothetical protein